MTILRRLRVLVALACAAVAPWAVAEDDPPGRVGRIAEVAGPVWRYDHLEGRWDEAERNRPLTAGDRLATGAHARAELRVGSTTLRLGSGSEFEVVRLDDERMVFQLHTGALALRVRSREVAGEIEVLTEEARLRPRRSGHYRIDRVDDVTFAGAWRGELRVADARGLDIGSGQRAELYRERRGDGLRHAWVDLPDDEFADWVAREDRRDEQRSASQRYVSPEMTGVEDLDRYGRWDRHPEYGSIWIPYEVAAGWAPYRYGRWVWVQPWGWTWIDDTPWGFAPFHYGRWVVWGGRWVWAPGSYVTRPVYAPALVAWLGGPGWGVSINIGGPAVGWVPLAPREVYVPWYRHTPIYVDRVNVRPAPRPGHRPPPRERQVPTGPIMYSNQGVPGAVTVVPRDVLVSRQPVGRAVVETPEAVRRRPIEVGQAPPAPDWARRGTPPSSRAPEVRMVPGGAVPVPPSRRVQPPPSRGEPIPVPAPVSPAPSFGRERGDGAGAVRPGSGEVIDLRQRREPADGPRAAPRDEPRDGRRDERRGGTREDLRPVMPPPAARAAPVAPVAPAAPPATVAAPAPVAPPVVAPAGRPARAPAQAGPAVIAPPPAVQPPAAARPPAARAPAPQAVPVPRAADAERRERDEERKRIPEPRHGQREREAAR